MSMSRTPPGDTFIPAVRRRRGALMLLSLVGAAFGGTARAQSASASAPGSSDNDSNANPFAAHHLALQLSDGLEATQKEVLNVAYNMFKQFSPDTIAIEVVTFGPGIALLYANNPNRERINSLAEQGVRFDVCLNTVHTVERDTGKKLELNPNAHLVDAGAAQIIRLVEKKYVLIRP